MRTNLCDAAKRYALADKSDPFALARAQCHLRNGVASYALNDGSPGYYDAEEAIETRVLPNGTEYKATVYRNISRP